MASCRLGLDSVPPMVVRIVFFCASAFCCSLRARWCSARVPWPRSRTHVNSGTNRDCGRGRRVGERKKKRARRQTRAVFFFIFRDASKTRSDRPISARAGASRHHPAAERSPRRRPTRWGGGKAFVRPYSPLDRPRDAARRACTEDDEHSPPNLDVRQRPRVCVATGRTP